MRIQTICICENKDADQLCGKVCVRPGQNPHCLFSHDAAQIGFVRRQLTVGFVLFKTNCVILGIDTF